MLDLLQTIVSFVVVLGVLITVHEYGHFWVARRCGVKVLRFSIGFGTPLLRWRDKHDTEFVVAALPLGGYVKMLGESPDQDLSEQERAESFAHKSVMQRIAIVAAGPLVNLAFATLIYWLVFVIGVSRVVPTIGEVEPDSIAALAGIQSGQEIVAVDGAPVHTWGQVNLALFKRLGDSGDLQLRVRAKNSPYESDHTLKIERWLASNEMVSPLSELGFKPYRPRLPVVMRDILPDSPAARADLRVGDRILGVDGKDVRHWADWVDKIRANPDKPMTVEVDRAGRREVLTITPASVTEEGKTFGRIGAAAEPQELPANMKREVRYGPLEAVPEAIAKTGDFIALTLKAMGKMITGTLALENLSGPVTIAKTAGDSARFGWEPFLAFMAYLSISLGVLNLLPIPVLDGGHLMYYAAELVKGRPVSERTQVLGNMIGLFLLVTFMGLAFYNDIMRL